MSKVENGNRQGFIKLAIVLLSVVVIIVFTLVVIFLILNTPPINNS